MIRTGVAFRVRANRAMLAVMPLRRHFYFAILAFIVAFFAQLIYRRLNPDAINDLGYPICAASALILRRDPYSVCVYNWQGHTYPANPLTTAILTIPFAFFGYNGGIVMWSLMVGLLVYGILRTGETWRLLMLLSAPFFVAALTLQWSPFITAIYFLPELLPLSLVKPQTAIPVILSKLNRRRLAGLYAFGLLTLAVDPFWPFKWWSQAQTYDGFIPLLVFPLGLLLLPVFLNWKTTNGRFLALMSIVPQRGFYDALALGVVASSWRILLAWVALTWVGYVAFLLLQIPYTHLVVVFCYLPLALSWLVPVYPTMTAKLRPWAKVAGAPRQGSRRGGTNIANGSR